MSAAAGPKMARLPRAGESVRRAASSTFSAVTAPMCSA